MQNENTAKESKHTHGYGIYILIWLSLMSLTALTVSIAGIDLGGYILFGAMLIASVKSSLVISIFMHIKYEDPIFKVFLSLAGLILLVVFILISFDIFYR
jgi:cytochrome c oxidase subunit IV